MTRKERRYLDSLAGKNFSENDNMEHFPDGPTNDSKVTVSPGGSFRATFNINILRNTANIASSLQVGVLGFAQAASGYLGLLVPPAGGTVAVTGGTQNALPNLYRFTYTVGLNVDTIDVTCPEIPYPSFLQNSAVDRYRINNIRYVISNGAIQAQFNELFDFRDSAIFGVKKTNPLTPSTYINPMDQKNNVVDIPIGQGMDKEQCIITSIQPQAAFSVNLTFFVEFYDKMTARAVGL